MGNQTEESFFSATDFRLCVRAWAHERKRGEYRRVAQALQIHTTLLSQILSGRKCLTIEQASRLCGYMGLSLLETDYLIKLVQLERAGDESLKANFQRHLAQLRDQALEAKSRVPEAKKMTEQDRALFYSSWQYTLIRLLTSIEDCQTPERIADRLALPVSRVREILRFLVSRGLCKEGTGGRFKRTEVNTHVEASSPLAVRHHQNWRAKAIEIQECMVSDDLAFTSPVSMSRKDVARVRALLLDTISRIAKIVENSPAEEVVYLGIDWIRI